MTTEEAIDTVARMAFANHGAEPSWEDYPDIAEMDWYAVQERCADLAAQVRVDGQEYVAAYELLAERADGAEAGQHG